MINCAALFPRVYYERKMSLVRRDVVRKMRNVSDGSKWLATISGQGWHDWNDSLSLRANLDSIMPHADALFWYKPHGNPKDGVATIKGMHDWDGPRFMSYNECWWPDQRALNEAIATQTTHVVIHHANDIENWIGHEKHGITVRHIPHCAEPMWFNNHPPAIESRPLNVIVTGALAPTIYPLRCHVANLVSCGQIESSIVRNHPGYRLRSEWDCDQQAVAYANALQASKLSMCCSSIYRYALAKYIESWMAGCVVVGDLPDDPVYCDAFGDLQIVIDENNARERIREALNDPADLQRRADAGTMIARERFSTDAYVHQFQEFVAESLA